MLSVSEGCIISPNDVSSTSSYDSSSDHESDANSESVVAPAVSPILSSEGELSCPGSEPETMDEDNPAEESSMSYH